MTYTLPLSVAKIQLSKLVDDVMKKEDEVLITRNGRLAAVLLSAEEYGSWKETQEIKSNPAIMREIQEGLKAIQLGKGRRYASVEELFGPPNE